MSKLFNNKFFSDPQNIIAVGVTFISLCALVVSVIQTSLLQEEREMMREHARASVWPHLHLGTTISHNKDNNNISNFKFFVTNSGVGPAIVTDVKVMYKDSIAKNWWHLFKIMGIPDSVDTRITNAYINKKVVKIGETITILNFDKNRPLANAFVWKLKQEKGLSIDIYYKSIYGEQWKIHDGSQPVKIEDFEGLPKEEQFD